MAIVKGGIERKESRGSHFRLDYPERDDANFLKSSIAVYDPDAEDGCRIEWGDIDHSLVALRARTYGKVDKSAEKKEEVAAS